MKYLSVCSGIEAASVAWHPLGWSPVAFAEIEKFPSAVLAHHYPSVPNLGDMTKFKDWPDADIDVLVGGTPCQSFSVAGLRQGLADPRGNLCLTFLAIADKYRPEWLLWENVPGVLSSDGGRDFGAFLGGLGQLGYGWSYRVLDAQYVRVDGFGRAVPQRRRRVFVVGNLRDWRRAAAVLFERESLHGNTAPRRQTGKGFATDVAPSIVSSGRGTERTGDTRGQDPVIAVSCAEVASTLNAAFGDKQGLEDQHINSDCPLFVTYATDGQANAAFSNDIALSLCATNEAPYVAHALRGEGFDASEDGTGRGTPLVPIAYSAMPMNSGKDFVVRETDVAQPIMAAGPALGNQGGDYIAQPMAFAQNQRDEVRLMEVAGALASKPGMKQQTYMLAIRGRNGGHDLEYRDDGTSNAILTPNGGRAGMGVGAIAHNWAVRRLTPVECERLQAFPDHYTNIPWRGKNGAPDGPRYKALGNSMAVNVMRWLGRRIELVSSTLSSQHSGRET